MKLPPLLSRSLLCLAVLLPLLACGRTSSSGLPGAVGGAAGTDTPAQGGTGGTAPTSDAGTAGGGGDGAPGGMGGDHMGPGPDAAASAPDGSDSTGGAGGAPMADAAAPFDGPPAERCRLPEGLPLEGRYLPNVPRSMDFAFDKAGNFVSIEMGTGALKATSYGGMPMTLLAGAARGFGRGAHYLPSGDFFLVDSGMFLTAISPQGKTTMLATVAGARGVVLDAQGRPVVSAIGGIYRLDGAQVTPVSTDPNRAAAVAFSPDYGTLYAATPTGVLRKMAIDKDGKAGAQQVFATLAKDGDTLIVDDMTVDECGNLFVVNASKQVWRVTPAGQMTKVVQVTGTGLGGPSFGSGHGGWKETALYVAVPSGGDPARGGVLEVELGFRGMKDPVISGP